MYANLAVSIGRLPIRRDPNGYGRYDERVYAWAVEIEGTQATIKLDAPEEDEPSDERIVDLTTHALSIAADF